jgi:hypothetical protein
MPATNFHDITTGSNGFAAAVGYDLVTGRGSPRADLVAAAFVGNAVALPQLAVGQDHGPSSTDNITNINQPTFYRYRHRRRNRRYSFGRQRRRHRRRQRRPATALAIGSTLADGQHSIQARVNGNLSGSVLLTIDTVRTAARERRADVCLHFAAAPGAVHVYRRRRRVAGEQRPCPGPAPFNGDHHDVRYNTAAKVATFTVSGVPNGMLLDGAYRGTMLGANVDRPGRQRDPRQRLQLHVSSRATRTTTGP